MSIAVSLFAAHGILAIALLVTWSRLRRRREQLHDNEARHGATLRALPDLMFVLSRAGVFLDFYTQHPDRLLRPPEDFLGRHVRDVLPPDLAAQMEDAFVRTLASREVVVLEYALEMPGGRSHFEARIVPCGNDNLLSIVRDVTARKTSERAVIASAEALRASDLHNQTLAGRLLVAQEEERQRIARDLHDDLGQRLALLNINVNKLAASRIDDPADLRARVTALSAFVNEIALRVHDLSHELHPSTAATLGLVPALRSLCRDMSGQHGLEVDFRYDGVPLVVEPAMSLSLYRIAQGALHNVVKHSGARRAVVELRASGDELELVISDEGCGFDAEATRITALGLVSMRERARLMGGECRITAADGRGTRVAVRVPTCNPGHTVRGTPA